MIYEYESADGNRIERDYPFGRFPRRIKENGVTYRKVLSRPTISVSGPPTDYWTPAREKTARFNNSEIAKAIGKGDPVSLPPTKGVSREHKADLERKIAAATGRTRL